MWCKIVFYTDPTPQADKQTDYFRYTSLGFVIVFWKKHFNEFNKSWVEERPNFVYLKLQVLCAQLTRAKRIVTDHENLLKLRKH